MTYTGEVTPGGTPDVRELQHLIITKVAVDDQMSNNCYVLRCRATDEQVLIDAAADAPTLLQVLGDAGASQGGHHPPALGPPPRPPARSPTRPAPSPSPARPTPRRSPSRPGSPIDDRVADGDTIEFGDVRLEVIHLVGHTPGSIALLYDDPDGTPHLFTGDSLFPGGVGNTFGDTGAFRSLLHDVRTKLFDRLPDETWFYPGHGNDSTLGDERPHLAEWEQRGW